VTDMLLAAVAKRRALRLRGAERNEMRRLKTLHNDAKAKRAVGKAAQMKQSGDNMEFGLLCYELGRISAIASATRCVVVGDPESFSRRLRAALAKGE
jgi:hypothetical protein